MRPMKRDENGKLRRYCSLRPEVEGLEERQLLADVEPNNTRFMAVPTGIMANMSGRYADSGTLRTGQRNAGDEPGDGADFYSLYASKGTKISIKLTHSEVDPRIPLTLFLDDENGFVLEAGDNIEYTTTRDSIYYVAYVIGAILATIPQTSISYDLRITTSDPNNPTPPDPSPPTLPDIEIVKATTSDAESVTVSYAVVDADINSSISFSVYRSSQTSLNGQSQLLGSEIVQPSNLMVGVHSIKLLTGVELKPDPTMPYVIVVADSANSITESNEENNINYFRKYLLAAISHGFNDDILGRSPPWEVALTRTLIERNYDRVIDFNWALESRTAQPGLAVAAGRRLADEIGSVSDSLIQHEGDVVDLHLIGHSRGSVVVSQAYLALEEGTASYLVGSYRKLTLIDPHPASNKFGDQFSVRKNSLIANFSLFNIITFQNFAEDPQIVVPEYIHDAELIYQHTAATRFATADSVQKYVNLWGHSPILIDNRSQKQLQVIDLTDVRYMGLGYIGHNEITFWYIENIAKTDKLFN